MTMSLTDRILATAHQRIRSSEDGARFIGKVKRTVNAPASVDRRPARPRDAVTEAAEIEALAGLRAQDAASHQVPCVCDACRVRYYLATRDAA